MTKEELDIVRLKMQILARDTALQALVAAVSRLPTGPQFLREWGSLALRRAESQTVPGVDAAYSELLAAEYQEAMQALIDGFGL